MELRVAPGACGSGQAPCILAVDDDVLIRAGIADYLQENGFTVLEASHAAEAIAILKSGSDIDLVFSDVKMPGTINGIGLAQWVRANRPEVAVLLTSGDSGKQHEAATLCAGTPVLAKPYDMDRVAQCIHALIGARMPLPPPYNSLQLDEQGRHR